VRAVLQRVRRARVVVEGREVGAIAEGYLALIGIECGDGESDVVSMARKVAGLRLFDDAAGRMNQPLGPQRAVLAV